MKQLGRESNNTCFSRRERQLELKVAETSRELSDLKSMLQRMSTLTEKTELNKELKDKLSNDESSQNPNENGTVTVINNDLLINLQEEFVQRL